MLWFTESSPEGLPFIHDSFRPNAKAIHHKPKQSHQPHADKLTESNGVSVVAKPFNHKDISTEALDSDSFKLPVVETSHISPGQTSSRTTPRWENGKDPVSFTSYMRRYRACARLKGFSPSRAYCSTRTRSTVSENNEAEFLQPLHTTSARDPLSTTAIPMSNLRLEQKPDHTKADSAPSAAGSGPETVQAEHPEGTPVGNSTTVNGSDEPSKLEKQIEEKLRRGSSEDDGMKTLNPHGSKHRRGRAAGRKGVGCDSGHGAGRVAINGGGRPLGDIVSSRRMQELLSHKDDRTLPYTYYRTAVGKEGPTLENVRVESPQ